MKKKKKKKELIVNRLVVCWLWSMGVAVIKIRLEGTLGVDAHVAVRLFGFPLLGHFMQSSLYPWTDLGSYSFPEFSKIEI